VVHPSPGATSTNSSSLLSSISHLHEQSHTNPTPHRTGDLCTPRQILLPRVRLQHKSFYSISYSHLHLALQVSHSMHRAYTTITCTWNLAHRLFPTSPRCLFIHYKIGLNMGKPMGRHPFPITYSQQPKKRPKRGSRSCNLCFILRSSFDRISKSQNRST
jgi:hypothetical protein